jgi:hypothetical protein
LTILTKALEVISVVPEIQSIDYIGRTLQSKLETAANGDSAGNAIQKVLLELGFIFLSFVTPLYD